PSPSAPPRDLPDERGGGKPLPLGSAEGPPRRAGRRQAPPPRLRRGTSPASGEEASPSPSAPPRDLPGQPGGGTPGRVGSSPGHGRQRLAVLRPHGRRALARHLRGLQPLRHRDRGDGGRDLHPARRSHRRVEGRRRVRLVALAAAVLALGACGYPDPTPASGPVATEVNASPSPSQ